MYYGVLRHFQQYLSYIVAVSFISGGSWSARRKPPTCRKQVTDKLYHLIVECPVLKKTLSYRVWVNGITHG
jgi:hypothetical protein